MKGLNLNDIQSPSENSQAGTYHITAFKKSHWLSPSLEATSAMSPSRFMHCFTLALYLCITDSQIDYQIIPIRTSQHYFKLNSFVGQLLIFLKKRSFSTTSDNLLAAFSISVATSCLLQCSFGFKDTIQARPCVCICSLLYVPSTNNWQF